MGQCDHDATALIIYYMIHPPTTKLDHKCPFLSLLFHRESSPLARRDTTSGEKEVPTLSLL